MGDNNRPHFLTAFREARSTVGARTSVASIAARDNITPAIEAIFRLKGLQGVTREAVRCHIITSLPDHADEKANFYSCLKLLDRELGLADPKSHTAEKLLADLKPLMDACADSDPVIISLISAGQKQGAENIPHAGLKEAAALAFNTVMERIQRPLQPLAHSERGRSSSTSGHHKA